MQVLTSCIQGKERDRKTMYRWRGKDYIVSAHSWWDVSTDFRQSVSLFHLIFCNYKILWSQPKWNRCRLSRKLVCFWMKRTQLYNFTCFTWTEFRCLCWVVFSGNKETSIAMWLRCLLSNNAYFRHLGSFLQYSHTVQCFVNRFGRWKVGKTYHILYINSW